MSDSQPSFSSIVRTMQAPARMTSARFGLEADDRAALSAVARAVELDLAVDLGSVEHRALDDVRVVRRERVLDGGEVRDRAAHADERVRARPAVEPGEVGGDRARAASDHALDTARRARSAP